MKNLYPKSKGKIHPSPAGDALAVLALLPVTALALTAALGYDDKEVVAYLITRSLNSLSSANSDADKKRSRKGFSDGAGAAGIGSQQHRPTFDCGCFDCYTSFWIRWDSSQQREVIHQVIEAFEEHLASSEKSKKKGSTSRRRDRRGCTDRAPAEKEKGKGKKKVEELDEVVELPPELAASIPSCGDAEEKEVELDAALVAPEVETVETTMEVEVEEEEEVEAAEGGGGERRKSWPDVMGIFNSRFWNLWSPGA